MITARPPSGGGCRTTSRSALSSRTLGTYRPQSARPIRTVVYVPGANCGLTRGDGGLCDSLGGPGSGSGAQEPVLSGSGAQEPVLGVVRPAGLAHVHAGYGPVAGAA